MSGARVDALCPFSRVRPRSAAARVVIASTTTDAEGRYRLRGLGASMRVDVAAAAWVAPPAILVEGTGPVVDVVVTRQDTRPG